MTLANVSLGETSDRALNGDLLQAATLYHLQVPCTRIFLHDVYHLMAI